MLFGNRYFRFSYLTCLARDFVGEVTNIQKIALLSQYDLQKRIIFYEFAVLDVLQRVMKIYDPFDLCAFYNWNYPK